MTTNDGLLEFNLVNAWQIYENLEANLELGYIVNMMDDDTWKKAGWPTHTRSRTPGKLSWSLPIRSKTARVFDMLCISKTY